MKTDVLEKGFRFYLLLWTTGIILILKTSEYTVSAATSNFESSYFFYQQSDYPRDCQEVHDQCSSSNSTGVYNIKPDGYPEPFEVHCGDNDNSPGWTVIFRRSTGGIISFNRVWASYKDGFGFLSHEFWIGNERLSYLTNQRRYQLLIEMIFSDGSSINASYDNFRIGDEFSKYKLSSLGQYSVTANKSPWCPANMVYGDCSCGQRLCREPTTCQNTCAEGQSEGCICPDGFYMSGGDCVLQEQCGCYISEERRIILDGETFVNAGCTRSAVCSNEQLTWNESYECDSNAVCDTRNGSRQCYCNRGYRGNGTTCTADSHTDCMDVFNHGSRDSGVYTIKPTNWPGSPFSVYCNMTDDGGWTVFQRRVDGSVDFYREWNSYKDGFGDVAHEHWLGNEKIYYLTNQRAYQMQVDMVNRQGAPHVATFSHFRISNEADNFRLTNVFNYNETAATLSNTDCIEINSPSYPNNYPDRQQVAWAFEAQNPSATLTLRFSSFATESCCDHVTVGSGSTILLQSSGGSIPSDVTSQGNSLWILFFSDGSSTRQGFSAVLSVNGRNCAGRPQTTVAGSLASDGGYALMYHLGLQFSTKDRDHDSYSYNCAVNYHGAWWFRGCHWSNLNGDYHASQDSLSSILWAYLPGSGRNIKFTEMKIRPV